MLRAGSSSRSVVIVAEHADRSAVSQWFTAEGCPVPVVVVSGMPRLRAVDTMVIVGGAGYKLLDLVGVARCRSICIVDYQKSTP